METRTRIYTVYKFNELPEEAKQKCLEKYSYINVDYAWWDGDGLLDIEQKKWAKWGLEGCLFKYKKFWFGFEREHFLEFDDLVATNDEILRKALRISKRTWKKTYYHFSKTQERDPSTIIEFELSSELNGDYLFCTKKQKEELDRAEQIFKGWIDTAIYNLRKDYEYLTSEKAIKETFEANDYEFTIGGKIN